MSKWWVGRECRTSYDSMAEVGVLHIYGRKDILGRDTEDQEGQTWNPSERWACRNKYGIGVSDMLGEGRCDIND